jgi:hypothetical protein
MDGHGNAVERGMHIGRASLTEGAFYSDFALPK